MFHRPSTSTEDIVHHSDNEYYHAENLGRSGAPCAFIFKECKRSLIQQFSGLYEMSNDIIKILGWTLFWVFFTINVAELFIEKDCFQANCFQALSIHEMHTIYFNFIYYLCFEKKDLKQFSLQIIYLWSWQIALELIKLFLIQRLSLSSHIQRDSSQIKTFPSFCWWL